MEMQYFLNGAITAIWIITVMVIPYLFAFIVWLLAKQDLFWTVVQEGQAKTIMLNDKFHHCVMSLDEHIFAKDSNNHKDKDPWEIVRDDRSKTIKGVSKLIPSIFPFIRNIYWIGIPPFSKVYWYDFKWTSLEEKEDKENHTVKKVPVTTDKRISYILILEDSYFSKIDGAETEKGERLPLDAEILITGKVVNPYKALFGIQHWLESSENQISSRVRKFFGTQSYDDLLTPERKDYTTTDEGDKEILSNSNLENINENILEEYGFKIRMVQLFSIDPGSEMAEDFLAASTKLYIAEQQAKANEAEGKGLAKRATALYEAISKIKGGKEMFIAEQISSADSSLSVITSQGALMPAVNVADVSQGGKQ